MLLHHYTNFFIHSLTLLDAFFASFSLFNSPNIYLSIPVFHWWSCFHLPSLKIEASWRKPPPPLLTYQQTVSPSHLAFLPDAQVLTLKTIPYICTLALTFSHLLKEFAPATLFFLSYMVNFSFIISIILKQMYKHEKKKSWPHFLHQVLLTDFVAENLEKNWFIFTISYTSPSIIS